MDSKMTIMALLGVAVMSGSLTYSVAQFDEGGTPSSPTTAGLAMHGHVTATVVNENGEITAYRQTDNQIVNHGLETIIKQVFGNDTGVEAGVTAFNQTLGHTVKMMTIGESSQVVSASDKDVLDRTNISSCANHTTTWLVSDGGADANPSTGISLVIVDNGTFGPSANCVGTINEAGLWTADNGRESDGALFARQVFGTGVTLGSSDTLNVNWDITFSDT